MTRYNQLLHQFKRELELRKYADSTISTYTSCLAVFLKAMAGKPAPLNIEEIKTFLLTIVKAGELNQLKSYFQCQLKK